MNLSSSGQGGEDRVSRALWIKDAHYFLHPTSRWTSDLFEPASAGHAPECQNMRFAGRRESAERRCVHDILYSATETVKSFVKTVI